MHGSPRCINEYLFGTTRTPPWSAWRASTLPRGSLFGHEHLPYARQVGATTFANVGSGGRPKDGDWRVCYAIVDPDQTGRR